MGIEGILTRADSDTSFRCANCFYHEVTASDLGTLQPYCDRRERAIRWDPDQFFCTDYAAGDNLDDWEREHFPRAEPPAPPARIPLSEFITAGAPRMERPVQTSLDDYKGGE